MSTKKTLQIRLHETGDTFQASGACILDALLNLARTTFDQTGGAIFEQARDGFNLADPEQAASVWGVALTLSNTGACVREDFSTPEDNFTIQILEEHINHRHRRLTVLAGALNFSEVQSIAVGIHPPTAGLMEPIRITQEGPNEYYMLDLGTMELREATDDELSAIEWYDGTSFPSLEEDPTGLQDSPHGWKPGSCRREDLAPPSLRRDPLEAWPAWESRLKARGYGLIEESNGDIYIEWTGKAPEPPAAKHHALKLEVNDPPSEWKASYLIISGQEAGKGCACIGPHYSQLLSKLMEHAGKNTWSGLGIDESNRHVIEHHLLTSGTIEYQTKVPKRHIQINLLQQPINPSDHGLEIITHDPTRGGKPPAGA